MSAIAQHEEAGARVRSGSLTLLLMQEEACPYSVLLTEGEHAANGARLPHKTKQPVTLEAQQAALY